jgi:WD40 repeat protein
MALASAGDDGVIKRWDVVSRSPISPDIEIGEPVVSVGASRHAARLVAGSPAGTVRIVDSATGRLMSTFERPKDVQSDYRLSAVSFTGDGRYVAAASNYTGLRILDPTRADWERFLSGHNKSITALSSTDSTWLLSAGEDGRVLEWGPNAVTLAEATGLRKRDDFEFHFASRSGNPVGSMDANTKKGLILTGSGEGRVELWDSIERVMIGAEFVGDAAKRTIRSVALAPDGSYFVTSDGSSIFVWPGPDRWAGIICSKLTWNMSRQQWREWVSASVPYVEQCPGLPVAAETPSQAVK